ncbi:MAG: dipicolinic acid synthetase [Lachnospiraceae bacterium]|nr:dipicolinic acid synthetase [Lachnospiraceae bacterium]
MHSYLFDYAVIGGDLRQVYLADAWIKDNAKVGVYDICKPIEQAYIFSSLEEAAKNARCILCPIPLNKDLEILLYLKKGQIFCAGCIPKDFKVAALEKGVQVFDYMQDVSLAHFNTIATAEGAICEAIKGSPMNLHKSKCMVLGYGKCARTLTAYLKGMFCEVTVAARAETELVQASIIADKICHIEELEENIEHSAFIFNTIPTVILDKKILLKIQPSALIVDIASAPGGVDYEAAKELSVKAISALSLPGKYAPYSTAIAMKNAVYQYVNHD